MKKVLSAFEPVHFTYRSEQLFDVSAYRGWPWVTSDERERPPLSSDEVSRALDDLPLLYTSCGKKDGWEERNGHIRRIAWIAAHYERDKANITLPECLPDVPIDGNHTLAAAIFLKEDICTEINYFSKREYLLLQKDDLPLEASFGANLPLAEVMGRQIVCLEDGSVFQFSGNGNGLYLNYHDKETMEPVGNVLFDLKHFAPVHLYGCKVYQDVPEEKWDRLDFFLEVLLKEKGIDFRQHRSTIMKISDSSACNYNEEDLEMGLDFAP